MFPAYGGAMGGNDGAASVVVMAGVAHAFPEQKVS
ncbi:MAG: hypothetical protein JWP05_1373 [Microbacteriaceae bacterium]|nr:hypothetical protein [Microbacteriaceae bacterium]